MKNKKFWLGMLVLTLAFGMTVIGCEGDTPEPDPDPYIPEPGDTYSNPIDRTENTNLGTMTSSDSGWQQLLLSIESTKKYINLDLSACTMTGTSFNPDPSVSTGKYYIVSIILPTVATSIEAGTSDYDNSTFNNFSCLKSVSGANIITIGNDAFSSYSLQSANFPEVTTIEERAFYNCSKIQDANFPKVTSIGNFAFGACIRLQSASFPLVTTIGEKTFWRCKSLVTLNIPKVTSIGAGAFGDTENTALTITMGDTAPSTLGYNIFSSIIISTKQVKVKVPSGAAGYTPFTGTSVTVSGANKDVNWANGFRGCGWNGIAFTVDFISLDKITLTIEQQ
jgi:hypothetical protein